MAELGAAEIAHLTQGLDHSRKMIFQSQYASERKDRGTATILALFMYDRIWLGDIALGILKLITLGLCGIWALIDIFTAGSRCDQYNRRKAQEILSALTSDQELAGGRGGLQHTRGGEGSGANGQSVPSASAAPRMETAYCGNCGERGVVGMPCTKCQQVVE